MKELGPTGQEYKKVFDNWVLDVESQHLNPVAADTYNRSIKKAELYMSLMDEDATSDFAEVLEQPVLDPTVEEERSLLLEMLDDIENVPSVIRKEQILARLDRLPQPEVYSDDTIRFATAYCVGRTLKNLFDFGNNAYTASTPTFSLESKTPAIADPTPEVSLAPVIAPEQEESLPRLKLPITLHRNNVLVFENGHTIRLERELKGNSQTREGEKFNAAMRFRVLQLLAEQPNKSFVPRELWELALPESLRGSEEYTSSTWFTYIGDFLEKEAVYNDGTTSHHLVRTFNRRARRTSYRFANQFDPEFTFSDDEYDMEDTNQFYLSNGEYFNGLSGQIMHLLAKSNKENLVTLQTVIDAGIKTPAGWSDGSRRFDNLVGSLRQRLQKLGLDDAYRIQREKITDGNGRRSSAWWMDWEGTVETAVEMESVTEMDEAERVKAEAIHRAFIVAQHIYNRRHLLAHYSIPKMDAAALDALAAADDISVKIEKDQEARHQYRKEAFKELSDALSDDRVDDFMDALEKGDPRNGLIDYIYYRLASEQGEQFKDCLAARVIATDGFMGDDGQLQNVTWLKYSVPGQQEPIHIVRDDQETMSNEALESLDQSSEHVVQQAKNGNENGNGQARMTNRERKNQQREEIRRNAVPEMRGALHQLRTNGLTKEGGVTVGQIRNVFSNLSSEIFERHIGKFEKATFRLKLEDVLYVHLAENGSEIVRKAAKSGTHRRMLRDLVEEQVASFRKSQARKSTSRTSS